VIKSSILCLIILIISIASLLWRNILYPLFYKPETSDNPEFSKKKAVGFSTHGFDIKVQTSINPWAYFSLHNKNKSSPRIDCVSFFPSSFSQNIAIHDILVILICQGKFLLKFFLDISY